MSTIMEEKTIMLRTRMQKSLRIDPLSEALPVMIVISRLIAIVTTIVITKMSDIIYALEYLDDIFTLHKEYIRFDILSRIIFIELPATTFVYNITVAFVVYRLVEKYNSLVDGAASSLKYLSELIMQEFEGIDELKKYKINPIPVVIPLAYNAFFRPIFLVPVLLYIDYKTLKGCRSIAKKVYEGVNAVINKDIHVILHPELLRLSQGSHSTASLNTGSAVATLLANIIISIPAAIRIHKIIRRVNTTLRVCRGTADTLASSLVMIP